MNTRSAELLNQPLQSMVAPWPVALPRQWCCHRPRCYDRPWCYHYAPGSGFSLFGGHAVSRVGLGLGESFSASSIHSTLSRRSASFSPWSSSVNELASNFDSTPTSESRISAIRSSRIANFRSNGARKFRISWICLRISSNVLSIPTYNNGSPIPPPCSVVLVNVQAI